MEGMEIFSNSVYEPFEELAMESSRFKMIERFTCVAYNNMTISSVNEHRHEIFSTKVPLMEKLPATQEALLQHSKRSHYQASIWENVYMPFKISHHLIHRMDI